MMTFYCYDCKTHHMALRGYKIPKVRNTKEYTRFYVCPNCASTNWTEVSEDGEFLSESEERK